MAAPNGGEAPAAGVVEALRDIMFEEVLSQVAPKLEEIEQRGRLAMQQAQERQTENTQKLVQELNQCKELQQKLLAENAEMKKTILYLLEALKRCEPVVANSGRGHGNSPSFPPSPPASPWEFPSSSSPDAAAGGGPPYTGSPMPPVPAFPYASHSFSSTTQEALSSAPAATAPAASAAPPTSPLPIRPPPGMPVQVSLSQALPPVKFQFTIRKADGIELGLECDRDYVRKVLVVTKVVPGSAVESWNRQCMTHSEKAVQVDDKIYCVNNISLDPDKMLQECQEKMLLAIHVWRGDGAPHDEQAPVRPASSFSAGASEFVPLSLASILEGVGTSPSPSLGLTAAP